MELITLYGGRVGGLVSWVLRFNDEICTYITSLKGSIDNICLFFDELNIKATLVC